MKFIKRKTFLGVRSTLKLLKEKADLTLFSARINYVLTFLDEILWCDHSNETSSAVHLHGTICFSIFYKKWDFSWILIFGTVGI